MLIFLGPWDFRSDYRISLALLIPEIIDNASDYYLQKNKLRTKLPSVESYIYIYNVG